MVDWSGGGDRGAKPTKDAIWIGSARGGIATEPEYCRNRVVAEDRLSAIIEGAAAAGERLLIGFDFPFGYPAGFARAVTGSDDPLALWANLADRLPTTKDGRERVQVAADLNALFPGDGPFWFDLFKDGQVPRTKPTSFPITEWRQAERQTKGTFSCWQIGGAGSVGSQALTGIASLERLRERHGASIWPFEPLNAPVAFVEIWPSLIADAVAAGQQEGEIKDAAQVRILAEAFSRLSPDELAKMLDVDAPEEGWILGLGHEETLRAAARQGRLRNDCFALPPGVDWTPVDDALTMLRDRLSPVTGEETLSLGQAAGRIAAADVTALRSHPPAANSAVDGYGLAEGLAPGLHHIPLVEGRAAAGAPYEHALPEGKAVRILTGATLPEGVTTVVLEEDCRVTETLLSVEGPLKHGANARKAGEDVSVGHAIVKAGRQITPADLALMAATGRGDVTVRKKLRVGVLSTGDELREAGDPLAPGQIGDANRPMLLAAIAAMGHEAVDLGICRDDRETLRAAFTGAKTDVLITSGGASAGEEDHVSALLTETGTMALWRIAVKPGRPLALGMWDGMPVFGLPGNPVAALVCTLIFARPALGLLAGGGWTEPLALTVPAAFSKRKKAGRREYLRARLVDSAAEVFASEGSGRISGLSWAEGLVELPDDALDVSPGTPVRYLPFAGLIG
ncbi:MAG: molybdopterin-binding protein [Rhodobacteraceae bacterium]|nr:molybdopterin-binding protein [Paracoccaceae bacterium]